MTGVPKSEFSFRVSKKGAKGRGEEGEMGWERGQGPNGGKRVGEKGPESTLEKVWSVGAPVIYRVAEIFTLPLETKWLPNRTLLFWNYFR